MNYAEISKETILYLYKSYNSLKNSPLAQDIKALIEIRVSQINGCDYCCKVHTAEAKKLGIFENKIDSLADWQQSSEFSDKEKLALQWAEQLTNLQSEQERIKSQLKETFSEREIVDLTACIALMNALNRLAISLRSF